MPIVINPYSFATAGGGGGGTRQAMVAGFTPVYVNVSSREAVSTGPVMVNGGS